MKNILSIVLFFISSAALAQQAPAQATAEKFAVRMKDSLGLTEQQRSQLYQLNMQLHEAKMSKLKQYGGTDSLRRHIQRVEDTRDELYRPVLTHEQFLLYLQKKRNLINNN